MYEIIPAIMPEGKQDLTDHIEQVVQEVPTVQLDIMDGHFVPEKTWPYVHGIDQDDYFNQLMIGEEGLPYWENINAELDLMIQNPEKTIGQWVALGPSRIVVHVESTDDLAGLVAQMQQHRDLIQFGLSMNNDTDIDQIEKYVDQIDFVQFMGIAEIGFQGNPFDERVFDHIEYWHEKYPDMPISVDGSVNADTITQLRDAGVTRFVAGSAVYNGIPQENIHALRNLLQ